ncbi:hypothetical protein JOM56_003018 [Amanita muscaria]
MSPLQPVVYVQTSLDLLEHRDQSETLVGPDYCLKWKAGEFWERVALSFVFHLFSSVVMAFLAHLRLAHPRLPLSISAIQTTADTTHLEDAAKDVHSQGASSPPFIVTDSESKVLKPVSASVPLDTTGGWDREQAHAQQQQPEQMHRNPGNYVIMVTPGMPLLALDPHSIDEARANEESEKSEMVQEQPVEPRGGTQESQAPQPQAPQVSVSPPEEEQPEPPAAATVATSSNAVVEHNPISATIASHRRLLHPKLPTLLLIPNNNVKVDENGMKVMDIDDEAESPASQVSQTQTSCTGFLKDKGKEFNALSTVSGLSTTQGLVATLVRGRGRVRTRVEALLLQRRLTIFLPSEYDDVTCEESLTGVETKTSTATGANGNTTTMNSTSTSTTTAACTTVTAPTAAYANDKNNKNNNLNLFHLRRHPRPRSLYLPRHYQTFKLFCQEGRRKLTAPWGFVPRRAEAGTLTKPYRCILYNRHHQPRYYYTITADTATHSSKPLGHQPIVTELVSTRTVVLKINGVSSAQCAKRNTTEQMKFQIVAAWQRRWRIGCLMSLRICRLLPCQPSTLSLIIAAWNETAIKIGVLAMDVDGSGPSADAGGEEVDDDNEYALFINEMLFDLFGRSILRTLVTSRPRTTQARSTTSSFPRSLRGLKDAGYVPSSSSSSRSNRFWLLSPRMITSTISGTR